LAGPEQNSISIGGSVSGGVVIAGSHNSVTMGVPSVSELAQDHRLSDWSGSRLFVSHAHVDAELTIRFVQLVVATTSLEPSDIFCSSLSGSGIPEGKNFVEYIRLAIVNAKLVVPLITSSYLTSGFCMCELGAAWALELTSFPFVTPSTRVVELTGVLGQVQAARLDDPSALDRLRDRLAVLDPITLDAARWPGARDEFVRSLGGPASHAPAG
jgi:hypothetical protein